MGAKKEAKREESAAKPTQITVMLRLVAGGYLVYLAFGLLHIKYGEIPDDEEEEQTED